MRFALLAGSASLLVAIGVFACSESSSPATSADAGATGGDDDDDGTSSSGGTSTSSSGGTSTSSGGTSGTTSSGGTSGTTSSGGTSGTTSSGGTSGTTSSGGGPQVDSGAPVDGGSAGTLCLEASLKEAEPNDVAANALAQSTFSYCGSITGADVDQLSFTLPANASKLAIADITTNAAIKVEATADGVAFPFGSPVFKAGKLYVFKVSSTGGVALDYRITVESTVP